MTCWKLLIGILFTPAEHPLLKLSASHFYNLITKNANENMMKKILIAGANEKKGDSNENFWTYCQELYATCISSRQE